MPPIPVYSDSPIVAAKPDGVTPKTASPGNNTPTTKTAAVPTPTSQHSAYPAAQPGAVPSLPKPTSTMHMGNSGPPPPQPGAVPAAIPPPPKAGERYQPPVQTPTATMPYPQQMSMSSPADPQPTQQRGTSTAPLSSGQPYGVQHPLAHPPGYHQNANASELDRYQRSAAEQRAYEDSQESSEGGSVWGAAKKLAQQTGERLAAAEHEVWKKLNNE
ncbi:hypothetical protein GGR57DRAFT_135605 [Xylariaceae sp. FL1272]|nr:hypothetical protein GGR57DRAFT_135605 [Xylariaceae sp. FL1272]